MKQYISGDRQISIYENGNGGPVILWGMYPHSGNDLEHLIKSIMTAASDYDFVLAAFQVNDWNREFSPWEFTDPFSGQYFAGDGPDTLKWLTGNLVPQLQREYGYERPFYLVGYSLAGLFSMWAAYETKIFNGIACCSGSLWYQDWDKYVETKSINKSCNVYLSLGGKEEKTGNTVMASVGVRTRTQEKILKVDKNVNEVILEWNSGGHFADSGKRLAKGIKWLLDHDNTNK